MSLCNRCLRSVALLAPRSSRTTLLHPAHTRYFTQTAINRNEDQADELKRVKERAWYLDPSPPTPSTSTSSSRPADRPRFTTFDPESTRSDTAPDRLIITPLPLQATSSPLLVQLHEHLTMQSDSVDPTTVRFLHPDSSKILQDQAESLLGETGGTGWTWVVVAQVRGRGRGVVNRAEKEIRKWVSSPSSSSEAAGIARRNLLMDCRCGSSSVVGRDHGRHRVQRAIPIGQWCMLVMVSASISSRRTAASDGTSKNCGRKHEPQAEGEERCRQALTLKTIDD